MNAEEPMLVTDDGISIDVSELQDQNAPEPMLVTDDGIVIDVSKLQFENAYEPIPTVLARRVTEVTEVSQSIAHVST